MLNDIRVGFVCASSSIRRGNKKTTYFIIFVLSLIFMNLVFLPSLINGMMGLFVGFVQDYAYGNVVVEPGTDKDYITNADNILLKAREIGGVRGAAKRLEAGGSLRFKQKVIGANIIGLVPGDEELVSKYPKIVKYGEFLGEMSRDEILIGSMIAGIGTGSEIYDNLGGVEVGSKINVTYSNGVKRQYKVRGIHEGSFELTDLGAIVHYKELESVLGIEGQDKASTIIVRTDAGVKESDVKNEMIALGVKAKVSTWQEKAESLIKQALQSMGALGIITNIFSLVVGGALIFIIIYIHTLNRKREIGILKAVGISPSSIIYSYLFISMFYVLAGILVGMAIFFSIVLYLNYYPLVFYETLTVSPRVELSLVVESVFGMIGMAIVAGFLPAWFVVRESILKAIWGR